MSLASTLTSRGLALGLLVLSRPAVADEPPPEPLLFPKRWPDAVPPGPASAPPQVLPPGLALPPGPPLDRPPDVRIELPLVPLPESPRPGRAATAGGIALLVLGTLGFVTGQVVLAFGASQMAFETGANLPTNRGGDLLAVGAYLSTGAAAMFAGGGVLVHWGKRPAETRVEPWVHPPATGNRDASGGLQWALRF